MLTLKTIYTAVKFTSATVLLVAGLGGGGNELQAAQKAAPTAAQTVWQQCVTKIGVKCGTAKLGLNCRTQPALKKACNTACHSVCSGRGKTALQSKVCVNKFVNEHVTNEYPCSKSLVVN